MTSEIELEHVEHRPQNDNQPKGTLKRRITINDALPPEHHSELQPTDKVKMAVICVLFLTTLILYFTVDGASNLVSHTIHWFDHHKALSWFLIWLLYFAAVPFILPIKTVLAIICGYLYGVFLGILLVFTAAVAGAIAAFVAGRYVCKSTVTRFVYSRRFMKKSWNDIWYTRAKEMEYLMREYPLQLAIALILTPIPFEWMNYFLSNTSIDFYTFLKALLFGRAISKSLLYVYLGSVVRDSNKISHGKVSANFWVSAGLALLFFACSLVVAYLLHKRANVWISQEVRRQTLEEYIPDGDDAAADSGIVAIKTDLSVDLSIGKEMRYTPLPPSGGNPELQTVHTMEDSAKDALPTPTPSQSHEQTPDGKRDSASQ